MAFSVLVVDDHLIVRHSIRALLERDQAFRVVGEAGNGAEALQLVSKHQPDLVLMDIGLPGMSGIEATTEICRWHPTSKVTILSMYGDEASVIGAAKAGARGFLLKSTTEGALRRALLAVAHGERDFSQVSKDLHSRVRSVDASLKGSQSESLARRFPLVHSKEAALTS